MINMNTKNIKNKKEPTNIEQCSKTSITLLVETSTVHDMYVCVMCSIWFFLEVDFVPKPRKINGLMLWFFCLIRNDELVVPVQIFAYFE